AEGAGLALVERPEARVETGRDRVRAQETQAEAVDRRDPRCVEVAREVAPAEADEPLADPAAQLTGRTLGVGDDEDRVDVDAAIERPDEALDQHRRLARPRAGGDEDEPTGLDRRLLL